MDYELIDLDPITIAGITLRTDNSETGFAKIQQHWGTFFQQGVHQQLGVEPGTEICEAYFDYESDANGAYTLLLGARLSPSTPPMTDALTVRHFGAGRYAKFHIDDPNAIRHVWQHIWSRTDLDRRYACDFELIGAQGADVYVSLK
ncbi:GyrI-like domain-containing protein [Ideonella sp. DXS29W]|uniref:GyrI-like domain-containing protein n=1 Tax=Ideonella lacteola TaxID=2984193 RepID=A0ABU9BXP8_9BURK